MKLVNPEQKTETGVLLVGINSRYTHTNPAVYSLRSYAAQKGWQVQLAEYNINASGLEILRQIVEQNCRTVAFSCYIWNIQLVVALTKLLKQAAPDTIILWGGPEVSAHGREWLQKLWQVDYLIAGEGEAAFAALLAVADPKELSAVPNLIWRDAAGEIRQNPTAPPLDLAELPFAYTAEELAALGSRILYYESSRGCPFGCHFCVSAREKVRYRPLVLVEADLRRLRDSGCKKIKFVDRTFNSDKKRARELISFLLEIYREELCFHIEIEPSCLDNELVALLAQAPPGYIQAEAGVQTLYGPALEAIGRKPLNNQAAAYLQKLITADNIHIHLDLIGCLPQEGLAEFKQSFEGLYQMAPHYLQLGFLKVLPGTILEQEAAGYGLVYQEQPPYQVLHTPWLSYREMLQLMDVEYAVDHYYNDGYFVETLKLAAATWQKQGLAFDFYRALALFDQQQEGSKSLSQKAILLYQFLCQICPEQAELWRHSIRLDCYLRKWLPPAFFEEPNSNLAQQYQKQLLAACPMLATAPRRKWHKEVLLFTLPMAVAAWRPGVYAALVNAKVGVWQRPELVLLEALG